MKKLLLLVIFFATAAVEAAPIYEVQGTFAVVFRSYKNGDHLFSRDPSEGPRNGYRPEPAGDFGLSPVMTPEFNIAIYRCAAGGRHFLTNAPDCERQQFNGGIIGYAAQSPHRFFNTVPLYRYYRGGDYVAALPSESLPAGYQRGSLLGYVMYTATSR